MIKTFIIAAQTADGFIARDHEHGADWTSKEDKKLFVELTKRAGVVIMGSKTYETIGRPLQDRLNIVYSKSGKHYEGVEMTSKPPRELLAELEQRGFTEAAICGGASIYRLFLEAGAVHEIYLTVEPQLFGQGVSLFDKPVEVKLNLKNLERLGSDAILMQYEIPYGSTD
ncbi:MAG TPA: dihydrofolate reductase family protein [Candidatus Paceibacterota bacterium]|nr:dihydrofolate reductase family protein [Candidatus Paceibacterota bacterium]